MRIMCAGRDTCRCVPKVAPHVANGVPDSLRYSTAQQTACGCPLPAPKRVRLAGPSDFVVYSAAASSYTTGPAEASKNTRWGLRRVLKGRE